MAWDALATLDTLFAGKAFVDEAPTLIAVFGQRLGGVEPGEMRPNYYVTAEHGASPPDCCCWRFMRRGWPR